jgi:2-methylcitrate dehydratase PrpD
MTKFSSGWGTWVGICAALLAMEGFTGISSAVDFSESSLPPFGESFEIERVYFKPYPSCRWAHPTIEGVLQLMKEKEDSRGEHITKITIRTFLNASHLRGRRPQTMESAQYSIPFLIGAAITDGKVTPSQVAEDRLSDLGILSVADKVEIIHCPELDGYFPKTTPTEIEVDTVSGSSYKIRVDVPKGDPQNPFSMDELREKFKNLAGTSIDPVHVEKIIERVEILEKLDDVSELTSLFRRS